MAAVKKIAVGDLPPDILGDLKALISENTKEYVVIGKNYYEIFPTPALKLMEVLGEFIQATEELRARRAVELDLELAKTLIFFQDLFMDPLTFAKIKSLVIRILDGTDEDDFVEMNLGQLAVLINKLVAVNMNTLPESFQKTFMTVASRMSGGVIPEEGPPPEIPVGAMGNP